MPLVYVTGCAGSGKSAIVEALRNRQIAAYDEDDPAIGSSHNTQSGQPVRVPPADAIPRDRPGRVTAPASGRRA